MRIGLISKVTMGLLISGLYMQPVAAHPHYWINLKADMILDEQGRLTAIRQHWAFDVFFSMMTTADVVREHGDKATGLSKMGDQMINNLAGHQYFSELSIDGSEIAMPRPSTYRLTENTEPEQPILELEMRFDISPPLAIKDKSLVWSVYDPTYYIAMNYATVDNVTIQGEQGAQCGLNLDVPNPSSELIEYAQQLDRTQRETDGLGINFAEKVRINC
ncbi:MAG: DUF1007 family protein [Gammaproteobacteria bacterium]|nr:DUF1007 family protein [Gammaproteobacteria bacterium]